VAQATNLDDNKYRVQSRLFRLARVLSSAGDYVSRSIEKLSALTATVMACTLIGSTASLLAQRATDSSTNGSLLITSIGQVHDLPPELATRARVEIVGTVTYYDPGQRNLFIEDKTGAVYIDTSRVYPLHYGDLVMVRGHAGPSYRTQVDTDPQIQILSAGKQIKPIPVTYQKLATGQMDCRLVRIRGKVRAINVEQHETNQILHLDISMPGGEVEVYQPIPAMGPAERERFVALEALQLLDAEVEIEGAAGGDFDTKSQMTGIILYAQQRSAIRVIKRQTVNALELPLSDIDTIFESHYVVDTSTRVRLRGTLTYYKKGEAAVLEQDGKSVFIETREDKDIPLGHVVDAVGFATDQDYAPSLREALLFDTHRQSEIKPKPVSYAAALSGIASDNLVSLEGILVSQLHDGNLETVVIDDDGRFVTGRLQSTSPLQQIRAGSRLRITGICRVVPGGSWKAPSLFHIEMRTPDDLAVLSPPSWWNIRHLVELLGSLGVLAAIISAWAILLRRRVRQQTKSIQLSMMIARTRSALLETISVHKTTEAWVKEFREKVLSLLPGVDCAFVFAGERIGQPLSVASLDCLIHSAPLRDTEGEEVGQIEVFSMRRSALRAREQDVCVLLTEVANLAVQQCLLYKGLIHHSTHDPLTDLPNRRLCEERLQYALDDAMATNGRVTVVYIDVDRFKEINDQYGHRTGDAYLKHVGARLRSATRSIDTLARVGGDEFLIIVPQRSPETEFMGLRERLQTCFEQPFEVEGHHFRGSASIGLASFPEHGATAEELQRHADQAMYSAKRKASSRVAPRIANHRSAPFQQTASF
jgi:diguanylate cyclase (GGDEF)-like protein